MTRRVRGSFAVPTTFSSAHVGHMAPLACHAAPRVYHKHKSCNKCPASVRRGALVCVNAATEMSQQRMPANEDVEGSMLDPSLANKNTVRAPCGWFRRRMYSAVENLPSLCCTCLWKRTAKTIQEVLNCDALNCAGAPGGRGCSGASDRQVF